MTWCDERLGIEQSDAIAEAAQARIDATLEALPIPDLVRGWRESSLVGLREQTQGSHAFRMYFDRLGHDAPERSLQFIESALATESDPLIALLAEEKFLTQLLHFHAPSVVDGLEAMAGRTPRLRWLLGSIAWSFRGGMVEDEGVAQRLSALADEPAFKAWERDYKAGHNDIEFASLSTSELGAAWSDLTARSPLDRARDGNASGLLDYQYQIVNYEPARAFALVREVSRFEKHPMMLSVLAAGILEDLLCGTNAPAIIHAVEAEAEVSPRFRDLLCGVWLSSADPDVADRVMAATGREAPPRSAS